MPNNATKPTYAIESVDNALRLLLMFREHDTIRVAAAAEHLGVARSTAHRLLAMLRYHDFVVQDDASRAYSAGPTLVDIGLAVISQMDIRVLARPHLEALVEEVAETVHLAVLRGTEVVFVDSVETSRAVRVGARVGASMPAHCTSVGKALLAQLPAATLRTLYPNGRLETLTANSVTTRAALERELSSIREVGYATNVGESEPDVAAIGMTVGRGPQGPLAAVAAAAPLTRKGSQDIELLAEPLRRCVERIEGELR